MKKITLESLSIYKELPGVSNFILTHAKGAILGPTGIGKSLGIPGHLITINSKYRYYVSVPNFSTARFLANRQKSISPGAIISYADDFHPPQDKSQIVYATSGYIKNKFLESIVDGIMSIEFADMLFIDEAHVTSIDNYLIVKLWQLMSSKSGSKLSRLYLLSASIDNDFYKFDPKEEIYNIRINHKNISIKYIDNDYKPYYKKRYIDMVNMIINQHNIDNKGTFMVFLPGKKEINDMIKRLQTELKSRNINDVVLLPAHGELPPDEIDKIFQDSVNQKIILTTNIFESVVTIDNVVAVFDSMLEKRLLGTEYPHLETVYISKASAIQRAGRTGRTVDGVCYRMCTRGKYDSLNNFKPMDINVAPIYSILINLLPKNLTVSEIKSILPISDRQLPEIIKYLRRMEIITSNNEISDLGRFYSKINLSVRGAAMLWWWMKLPYANKYPGIVATVLINNYKDPYYVFNDINRELSATELQLSNEAYKSRFNKFRGESDLHTYMNAWLDLVNRLLINSVDYKETIREWCFSNGFKFKRIYNIYETCNNIMYYLVSLGYLPKVAHLLFNTNDVIYNIKPIIMKVYSDKVFKLNEFENCYKNKSDTNDNCYYLELNQSVSTYAQNPPKIIVSFYEYKNPKKNVYRILFGLGYDLNDTRIYNPNVIVAAPSRKSEFPGIKDITYIKYPITDVGNMLFSIQLDPEIPEQNLIIVGQIYPYDE